MKAQKLIVFTLLAILLLSTFACGGGATTGSINVVSDPAGAAVYLDGVDTGGVTPYLVTELDPGDYTIKLTYYHYKDKVETVTVKAGKTTDIDWALTYADETTLTIQPGPAEGKDAYIVMGEPDFNGGSTWWLSAGANDVYSPCRTYLQFDLSTIPATAVVTDANLGLYNYYYELSRPVAASIGAYDVTSNWDEGAITWSNQPTTAATPETTTTVPVDATYDFICWSIDKLVQGWIDGSIPNYGIMLKDTDESTPESIKWFWASDYTGYVGLGPHPKLVVAYYDPADP